MELPKKASITGVHNFIMITVAELEKLSRPELKSYLQERYSGTAFDPPLAPLGDESPHEFVAGCYNLGDRAFSEALQVVHVDLLADFYRGISERPPSTQEQRYLHNLLLAIDKTRPEGFFSYLFDLFTKHGSYQGASRTLEPDVERQLLIALARVQPRNRLTSFWQELWHNAEYRPYYNEIFFGLMKADLGYAMAELPRALKLSCEGPGVVEPGGLLWNLVNTAGVERLIDALYAEPPLLKEAAAALRKVGANESICGALEQAASHNE